MNIKDIISLGIETSCDETAAAVVLNGREILSNVISSQIDIHKEYGGVVPEIASRNHIEAIDWVVKKAVRDAGVGFERPDLCGVTVGAGLVGALLVGLSYAKGLRHALGKPLYAVNHIEGHIAANYLTDKTLTPPLICLIASGGHTAIVEVKSYTEYEMLASTVDDAAGEAFDKVARILGLPYPGGVEIDRLSKNGEFLYKFNSVITSNGNFSYSGLKTAVMARLNGFKQKKIPLLYRSPCGNSSLAREGSVIGNAAARLGDVNVGGNPAVYVEDICRSFSEAATEGLVERLRQIFMKREYRGAPEGGEADLGIGRLAVAGGADLRINRLAVAGGVGANTMLREKLTALSDRLGLRLTLPRLALCTDNGAMIAAQAYYMHIAGVPECPPDQNALPTLRLRGERPH